jgi:hypothetical protein
VAVKLLSQPWNDSTMDSWWNLNSWWNFFYLCGSAAATLTGLMFIAVPLGSALIRKDNLAEVNVFLSPLCFHFLHVFFLCCMTAVPGANPWLIAVAAIVTALLRLATMRKNYSVLRVLAQKEESNIGRSDWILLMVFPTIIYLSLVAAGIGFLMGKGCAVPVLAASCLVLLLISARGAWDTLVAIAVLMPSGQNGPDHDGKAKNAEPS